MKIPPTFIVNLKKHMDALQTNTGTGTITKIKSEVLMYYHESIEIVFYLVLL
jgi:hypothetical protein